MDRHTQTLLKSAARAFYDTRHILVIDALILHSALPNEDLAVLLGMQQKDLRKLCGKLREDKLLSVHSRQEMREGMQRPIHRDYYYVDTHAAIDAIKYRVWHLTEKVKDLYRPSEEKKDYVCPRCRARWTQMEVLDNVDPDRGFLCHRCQGPLRRDEVSAADRAGHERHSRLMTQLEPLLRQLKAIDDVDVPANDFQTALAKQVPVKRDPAVHPPGAAYVPVKAEPEGAAAAAARTAQAVSAADLEISMLNEPAPRAADALEKERRQNALPVWHTQSTVGANGASLVKDEPAPPASATANGAAATTAAPARPLKREASDEADVKPTLLADTDAAALDPLAAYYAEMQEERMRAAARDSSEASGGEDDDDDDDGFEDVGLAAGNGAAGSASGVNTPSSSMSGGAAAGRKAGSSGGASTSGGGATPATGTPRDRGSPTKRVRLDIGDDAPGGDQVAGTPAGEAESEEDDFEDAL